MNIDEITKRLPKTAGVMGLAWLQRKREWAQDFFGLRMVWYKQLEKDLAILEAKVDLSKLTSCYRSALRNAPEIQKAMFEIHAAALMASVASDVDLHVRRGPGSRKNFDIRATINGCVINADSKTRKDEFPFNVSPPKSSGGLSEHFGARATVDPHDAVELGLSPSTVPRTGGRNS